MTLNAVANITNIKRSLDFYCRANLNVAEELDVDFEGLPFDETSVSEWVMPRILDIDSTYRRQGSSTRYGESVNIMFQINIFVKKGGMRIANRTSTIRDMIVSYFRLKKDISLRSYLEGETTLLDSMRVRKIVTDFALPETETLYQHALAWNLVFTRLTDNP